MCVGGVIIVLKATLGGIAPLRVMLVVVVAKAVLVGVMLVAVVAVMVVLGILKKLAMVLMPPLMVSVVVRMALVLLSALALTARIDDQFSLSIPAVVIPPTNTHVSTCTRISQVR